MGRGYEETLGTSHSPTEASVVRKQQQLASVGQRAQCPGWAVDSEQWAVSRRKVGFSQIPPFIQAWTVELAERGATEVV